MLSAGRRKKEKVNSDVMKIVIVGVSFDIFQVLCSQDLHRVHTI